jgi:hypothetical protein
MDHTLTWLLLVAAVILIGLGATRFDLLGARWREFLGKPPCAEEEEEELPARPAPRSQGMRPHQPPPPHKPAFHRSGRRH